MSVPENQRHQSTLPKTGDDTSAGLRMNTIGMNAIKLIFDPESQRLYQQEGNGNFVVSDMQFANGSGQTLESGPPPTVSALGQQHVSKSKKMKSMATPTFVQQMPPNMGAQGRQPRHACEDQHLLLVDQLRAPARDRNDRNVSFKSQSYLSKPVNNDDVSDHSQQFYELQAK